MDKKNSFDSLKFTRSCFWKNYLKNIIHFELLWQFWLIAIVTNLGRNYSCGKSFNSVAWNSRKLAFLRRFTLKYIYLIIYVTVREKRDLRLTKTDFKIFLPIHSFRIFLLREIIDSKIHLCQPKVRFLADRHKYSIHGPFRANLTRGWPSTF